MFTTSANCFGAESINQEMLADLSRPDEREVDPERAVDAGAVDADEDAVRHAGPGRVLGVAVEAHLENILFD
jgi:hypothetical protein